MYLDLKLETGFRNHVQQLEDPKEVMTSKY